MASTSERFRAAEQLRVRPVPEWDSCLVLDAERARLHELNLTCWLILELAQNLGYSDIVANYEACVGDRRPSAARDVQAGLRDLLEAGLLVRYDVNA